MALQRHNSEIASPTGMHVHQMILKIRTRAVRVLDLWAQRWYARHAMWDDVEADPSAVGAL